MKNIITTLPIYPGGSPTLSHIISPYIGKLLQKNLKDELGIIIPMNLLGEKSKTLDHQTIRQYIDNYNNVLQKFNIESIEQRNDIDNTKDIKQIIDELHQGGKIDIKEIEIIKCNKGCSEMISTATTFGNKKNTTNNNICNKCNTPLYKEVTLGLLLSPTSIDNINIYSKRFASFINDYNNFFYNGRNHLYISRTRETGYKYIINGHGFNLDIDFINACWLISLEKIGLNPKITLSNPSSLINTYWGINIYRNFSSNPIDIVVHPYIGINDNTLGSKNNLGFKDTKFNLNQIIETNKIDIMKLLIGIGINFKGRDTTKIDISNIKKIETLLKTSINKEKTKQHYESLEQVLEILNGSNVINAINGKIGKKDISFSDIQNTIQYFL